MIEDSLESVKEAYGRADASAIIPSFIAVFSSGDFSEDLCSRLVVPAQGLLGVGAYGAVYEAALSSEPSDQNKNISIVAVKYQALPEEVRRDTACCTVRRIVVTAF